MPYFDFKCPACGKEEEEFYKLSDYNGTNPCTCGEIMKVFINKSPALHGSVNLTYEQKKDIEYWHNDEISAKKENDKWKKEEDKFIEKAIKSGTLDEGV